MAILQDHEVMINLALFKRYQFYQLFDPNGPRVFGYNVHRSLSVASIAFLLVVNVYSALTFFVNIEMTVDAIDSMLIRVANVVTVVVFVKILTLLRRADIIWGLYDSTRLDFLTSARCRGNVAVIHRYRDSMKKLTDYFLNYTNGVFVTWCTVPLVYNAFAAMDDPNQRYQNVFNLKYPVTVAAFNRYFFVFYLMEVIGGAFMVYYSVIIDVFIVSICFVLTAQYEVLGMSFASVGLHHVDKSTSRRNDNGHENDSLKAYKDFESIIHDQINVYRTLKSFYSVIWRVIFLLIFINTIALIILSYSCVVIFMATESLSIYRLIKLPSAYICLSLQILLYCYLFGKLNDKKASVNFAIYSCDWTKMDLKFKHLLLLAMRMNNADQLMIKSSPTTIVNMQLFAKVMSTTYNIASVMLNRKSKNAAVFGS